jgi:hypothetical protein
MHGFYLFVDSRSLNQGYVVECRMIGKELIGKDMEGKRCVLFQDTIMASTKGH